MRPLLLALVVSLAACRDSVAPVVSRECQRWQTTPQSIANAEQTTLSFDAAACDFGDDTDRITLPPGRWIVLAQMVYAPSEQGQRGMCLFKNGTTVIAEDGARPMLSGTGTILTTTAVLESDGATFVTVTGTQTSGATLRTMVGKVGPNTLTYIHAMRLD